MTGFGLTSGRWMVQYTGDTGGTGDTGDTGARWGRRRFAAAFVQYRHKFDPRLGGTIGRRNDGCRLRMEVGRTVASGDAGDSSEPVSSEPGPLIPVSAQRPKQLGKLLQSVNLVGISSYVSLVSMYISLKLSRKGQMGAGATGSTSGEVGGQSALIHPNPSQSIPILPSMETPDIRNINWAYLYEHHHIRGVMFDKDHTLTLPYASSLHPYAAAALEEAKRVFGSRNVVLYSNSAGLKQYDPDGVEAGVLEERLGVHVLRHGYKKPFVSDEVRKEVEGWCGVGVGQLVMVGDRYMTDVVFGNRLGMMTVRVKPFVEVRGGDDDDGGQGRRHTDPQSVRLSRRLEEALVRGFRGLL